MALKNDETQGPMESTLICNILIAIYILTYSPIHRQVSALHNCEERKGEGERGSGARELEGTGYGA